MKHTVGFSKKKNFRSENEVHLTLDNKVFAELIAELILSYVILKYDFEIFGIPSS
jgi:hypothetical protein